MEREISWPGWEVTRRIGQGGFGAVYEIQREFFGRTERAALKVISIPQSDDEIRQLYEEGYDNDSITNHFRGYLEELVQEYSLMLELKGHTNIVYCDELRYIQHADGIGWDIYIKMELLTPLKAYVGKEYDEQKTLRLGMDMCQALILCQNQNIVHRDIKPENIFVSRTGDCKLGDFGVAKVSEKTASGTKIGTYEYMAPEVYRGLAYGTGADIYSLGLVLYWMMNNRRTPFLNATGQIPTMAEKETARNRRFGGEPLPRPRNGSAGLQRVVLKACAYNPAVRYTSAAQMLEDLQKLQYEEASVREETVRKPRRMEYGRLEMLTGDDPAPVSVNAQSVQGSSYRKIGDIAPEYVGVQGAPYRQTGAGVREEIGLQQRQTRQQPRPNGQGTGMGQIPPQTRAKEKSVTTQRTKENKKKTWIVILAIFLSLMLVGVVIGLGKMVVDSLSGLDSAQRDPSGNDVENEDVRNDSGGEEHLIQTLTFEDGSYMELYCDENDNEVRRDYYSAEATLLFQCFAAYDENGNLVSHEVYDGAGELFGAREKTYDKNNKVLTDIWKTADGTVYRYVEYQRTEEGDLDLQITYDGEGNQLTLKEYIYSTYGISEVYTYDAQGRELRKEEYSYHAKDVLSQIVTHDEYGYTDISYYNEEGVYCGYEYYDENGTLRHKTVMEIGDDGKPIGYYSEDHYSDQVTSVQGEYDLDYSDTSYRAREYRDGVQVGIIEWVEGIDGTELKHFYYNESGYSVYDYNGVGHEVSYSHYEDGTLVYRYETDYDNAGRRTEEREYDETDSLVNWSVWEYNARGQELKYITYNPDGTLDSSTEYIYGDLGELENIACIYYYESGDSHSLYDANWNIMVSTHYDADGSFSSRTEYDRDANGNAIRCRRYYEEGVLDSQEVYTNDSDGNRIRTDYYDNAGKLKRSLTVTYNENGDPVKETWYDDSGKITGWSESTYSEDGLQEKRVEYDADGTQRGWTEYFYDENGYYLDSVWHEGE